MRFQVIPVAYSVNVILRPFNFSDVISLNNCFLTLIASELVSDLSKRKIINYLALNLQRN